MEFSEAVPTIKRQVPPENVTEDCKSLEPLSRVKKDDPEVPVNMPSQVSVEEEKQRIEETKQEINSDKYKRIQFRDIIYDLNDFVFIRESKKSNMIGQLMKIIPFGGDSNHPKWPMIEIRW